MTSKNKQNKYYNRNNSVADAASRRANRSDKYQHLLLETACSNEMMESFSTDESIYKRLNPFDYNEEILKLEDKLKDEFWRIVEQLTPRQREVIKLTCKDFTQMHIAKLLNVNQSSITKSLHGNVDYQNGKKSYGGAIRRMIKITETDPVIQEIIAQINEIRDNKY